MNPKFVNYLINNYFVTEVVNCLIFYCDRASDNRAINNEYLHKFLVKSVKVYN